MDFSAILEVERVVGLENLVFGGNFDTDFGVAGELVDNVDDLRREAFVIIFVIGTCLLEILAGDFWMEGGMDLVEDVGKQE